MSGFVAENMAAGVPGDNSFWVDADAKVRQLRGEVVASMKKAQLRSEDPRAREAAEADLKRELVEVKTTIAQAQEKYERARMHFRTLAQRTNGTICEGESRTGRTRPSDTANTYPNCARWGFGNRVPSSLNPRSNGDKFLLDEDVVVGASGCRRREGTELGGGTIPCGTPWHP